MKRTDDMTKQTKTLQDVTAHNVLQHNQADFLNVALNAAVREIQTHEEYRFRIIALVRQNKNTWTAEGTGLTISVADPENTRTINMKIRKEW